MKWHAGLIFTAIGLVVACSACDKSVNSSPPADADIYNVATSFLSNEISVHPEEISSDTTFKIEQDPDSTYTVGMFVKLKNVTSVKIPESVLRDNYTLILKYKGGNPKEMQSWIMQDLEYDE